MRYYTRKNDTTLEAVISMHLEEQPLNSIPYYESGFKNPTFKDETCTELIEGVILITEQSTVDVPQEVLDFIAMGEKLKQTYNL